MPTQECNIVDSSFSLLVKTLPFLIFRFIVVIVLLIPFIPLVKLGLDLCLLWFGDVLVAKLCYCYIVIAAWYIYMELIRKYVLYMLKVAQMASLAKYLTGQQSYCSVLTGFITSIKKVASAHLMFVINCLIESTINKFIAPKIKELPIANEVSDKWYGKFVGRALNIIVNHIDEAVLCYGFIDDSKGIVESLAEGVALYVLRWKEIAISSVKAVVGLMAFNIFIKLCCAYYLISVLLADGLHIMSIHAIFLAILMYGLYYTLYEPYLCVIMLRKYIVLAVEDDLNEDEVDIATNNVNSIMRNLSWREVLQQENNQAGETILTRLFGVQPPTPNEITQEEEVVQ